MPHGPTGRWLTSYQKGSIFGAVIVFVAFAAAFSVIPIQPEPPQNEPHTKSTESVSADHRPSEFWRQFIPQDAVGAFTLGLMLVAGAQAIMFLVQLRYMNEGLRDAGVATKAAQLSAEAAAAGNRPWLRVTAELDGQLVFDQEGVSLKTKVFVENVGRSPAVRVTVSTAIGVTNNFDGHKIDGAQWAVNKAQISHSERITYGTGRTVEELKRLSTIGDVIFPDEKRQIETIDRAASRFELFGNSKKEDERTFDGVFYAVSAEYRVGSDWGVTTVVYAVEQWPEPGAPADGRFKVASRGEHKFDVTLHKLQVYTTAT